MLLLLQEVVWARKHSCIAVRTFIKVQDYLHSPAPIIQRWRSLYGCPISWLGVCSLLVEWTHYHSKPDTIVVKIKLICFSCQILNLSWFLIILHSQCVRDFSHGCDKIPTKVTLKKGGSTWGYNLRRDTAHNDGTMCY